MRYFGECDCCQTQAWLTRIQAYGMDTDACDTCRGVETMDREPTPSEALLVRHRLRIMLEQAVIAGEIIDVPGWPNATGQPEAPTLPPDDRPADGWRKTDDQ
jgi:hypothetical protein